MCMFWGERKEGLKRGGENDPGPWFSSSTPPEGIGRNKGEWMLGTGERAETGTCLAPCRYGGEAEGAKPRNQVLLDEVLAVSSTSTEVEMAGIYPIEPPFDLRYMLSLFVRRRVPGLVRNRGRILELIEALPRFLCSVRHHHFF